MLSKSPQRRKKIYETINDALIYNDIDCVKSLINEGNDINELLQTNVKQEDLINFSNYKKRFLLFIDQKIQFDNNISMFYKKNYNAAIYPIFLATIFNNSEYFRKILDLGGNLNLKFSHNGFNYTIINFALVYDSDQIIKFYIENFMDLLLDELNNLTPNTNRYIDCFCNYKITTKINCMNFKCVRLLCQYNILNFELINDIYSKVNYYYKDTYDYMNEYGTYEIKQSLLDLIEDLPNDEDGLLQGDQLLEKYNTILNMYQDNKDYLYEYIYIRNKKQNHNKKTLSPKIGSTLQKRFKILVKWKTLSLRYIMKNNFSSIHK